MRCEEITYLYRKRLTVELQTRYKVYVDTTHYWHNAHYQ